MATVTNVVGRGGKVSGTKFTATLEGGPQLAKALQKLDDAVRVKAAKDGLAAGGRLLADEWARRVPIGEPPDDEHPGAYRRAMEADKAVTVRKAKNGATATVGPALLGELEDNQQPRVYAPRLEFGDASRVAQPSARPAFDAVSGRIADMVGEAIRKAIAEVTG